MDGRGVWVGVVKNVWTTEGGASAASQSNKKCMCNIMLLRSGKDEHVFAFLSY